MKKIVVLLLSVLLLAGAACADGPVSVLPKPAARDSSGPLEGKYCIGVEDAGHLEEGWFRLSVYSEDRYDGAQIENLKPGDTVAVNGTAYTVAVMLTCGYFDSDGDGEADLSCTLVQDLEKNRDLLDACERVVDGDLKDAPGSFEFSHYELIPSEAVDGYIGFEPVSENEYRAVQNDWSPCTYLEDITIRLPLPEKFIFEDYAAGNEGGPEAFLADISEAWYTPWNTDAWFEAGLLVKVSHSDYPAGPMD